MGAMTAMGRGVEPVAAMFGIYVAGMVVVTALGYLFGSNDQQYFLLRVWQKPEYQLEFMRNGALLAFIPVFFEGAFWLVELSRREDDDEAGGLDAPPKE